MNDDETRLRDSIYHLADHLDAILAAGEDLRALRPIPRAKNPQRVVNAPISMAQFAKDIRLYEMSLVQRTKRARVHTRTIVPLDQRFAALGGLFVAGTAALEDAIEDLTQHETISFETANDPVQYFRSRAMIGETETYVKSVESLQINDTFLIAGKIKLGPLLDLAATFLDTLDRAFDLYPPLDGLETEKALADSVV